MKNLIVNNPEVELVNGDQSLTLTLRPVTFARLNEITNILEGKDLATVLSDPNPLDTCKIAYCLLTEESKSALKDLVIKLNDEAVETNLAHKLYYFTSECHVSDGYRNLLVLSETISNVMIDSMGANKKKVKIFKIIFLLIRRSCMILWPILMVLILTMHLWNNSLLDKFIEWLI